MELFQSNLDTPHVSSYYKLITIIYFKLTLLPQPLLLLLAPSLALQSDETGKKEVIDFCQAGVSRGQYGLPPAYLSTNEK